MCVGVGVCVCVCPVREIAAHFQEGMSEKIERLITPDTAPPALLPMKEIGPPHPSGQI